MLALINLAFLLDEEPSGREEALALYRRALVVDPNYVLALNSLAYFLSKEPGGLAEAEQLLRRALEIEPNYCFPLGNLGVVLSARGGAGAMAEALQLCERAAEAAVEQHTKAHASAALGIVLLRSGDAATAREKLAEALGFDAAGSVAADLSRLLE